MITQRVTNAIAFLNKQMQLFILNPYHAGQILPILPYVPSVTKVTLLHFIHRLLSVTKVSATIVFQKLCNFECVFNIVKLF